MGNLWKEIAPQIMSASDAMTMRNRCESANETRRAIIPASLLVTARELQKHAAFRNDLFALFQPGSNLYPTVLLGAQSYRPPREFTRAHLDVNEGFIFRISKHS